MPLPFFLFAPLDALLFAIVSVCLYVVVIWSPHTEHTTVTTTTTSITPQSVATRSTPGDVTGVSFSPKPRSPPTLPHHISISNTGAPYLNSEPAHDTDTAKLLVSMRFYANLNVFVHDDDFHQIASVYLDHPQYFKQSQHPEDGDTSLPPWVTIANLSEKEMDAIATQRRYITIYGIAGIPLTAVTSNDGGEFLRYVPSLP
jgi:hypothetical protein